MSWVQRFSIERSIIWWLLTTSLFTMATVSLFLYPIHHDVAWYLYASGRLVDGAKLYQDIVGPNPPLIFLWNIPPVWMGRLLESSEITIFRIYLLLVVVLSLGLCGWVLNESLPSTPIAMRRCLLLVLVSLFLRPYFFGQREHIMFVLVTPYILAAVGWAMENPLRGWLALFVGSLAGVGLALKPYFLVLWLIIESYLTFVRRTNWSWRKPENVGIAVVLVIYAVCILFWVPEYYKKIIPMAAQVYGAYNCATSYLFGHPVTKLWVLTFLAFLVVRPTASSRELRRVLLMASMSFLIVAFAQHKGFYLWSWRLGEYTILNLP